ncbi:hypothetical protein ACL655_22190 [Klebsiella quasipneumoniae subsp. similipneumoniae]
MIILQNFIIIDDSKLNSQGKNWLSGQMAAVMGDNLAIHQRMALGSGGDFAGFRK